MSTKKNFKAAFNTGGANTSHFYYNDFYLAKWECLDSLQQWMEFEISSWKNGLPTTADIEIWDDMIKNWCVEIYKYDEEYDYYTLYWVPSEEELKEIGWVVWAER